MLFRSLQGLLQDIQQIAWRNLLLWLWKGMRKLPNEVWVLLKVQHLDLNRPRNDTSTQSTQIRDKC